MSRNMQQTANNASSISTYPIITKFNGWIPVVSQRAFSQPPSSRCAALPCRVTWSLVARNCFSGPSEHSIGHWRLRRGLCPVHLVPRSWRFVLRGERQSIASMRRMRPPPSCRPSKWDGKELAKHWRQHSVHGLCRCGFEGAHRIGRAHLGLTPTFDRHEVEDKFGSWQEYERFKQSFSLKDVNVDLTLLKSNATLSVVGTEHPHVFLRAPPETDNVPDSTHVTPFQIFPRETSGASR